MSLDISYYTNLVRVADMSEDRDPGEGLGLYPNPDFLDRADGLTEGIYDYEDGDSFRAGSYLFYNVWREWLAGIAGYKPEQAWAGNLPPETPFLPLVNFSDCEGLIGPQTSARLAADFESHRERAVATGETLAIALFDKFHTAFRTAAENNGAVDFH